MHASVSPRTTGLASAVLWIAVSAVPASAQPAADRGEPSRPIAIRGATIMTAAGATIAGGTIVIQDGRITAVGADVSIPAAAEIVEASGRFVTPGLIDAHSHIAADSINEGGTTVSSMTGVEDVLNPIDINIYRDLAGGVTTANILHGSANPIGGRNAVIKLRWGKTRAEELIFEGAPPGIKFALGENPKDMRQVQQTGPRRYPVTRSGVEFVIRDAFTRAKAYRQAWQVYEKQKQAGADVGPPRRDLQLEPLVEILEGKRLVHAHCYRADEILMLLRLAEEIGFRIATLQHVLEGYKVAKEIAAHGAGASTFSDWWGYKVEAADAIPHNAALMTRKGVLVSVNSDSAEHARRLNSEAAKSIKWGGLSDEEALALVTINPAKQLRIDHRVGSIEAGKDADLVIWNRHPLSNYAIVDRTYIDGVLYYDRPAEEQRLTRIEQEKSGLLAAERDHRRAPAAGTDGPGGRTAPPRATTTIASPERARSRGPRDGGTAGGPPAGPSETPSGDARLTGAHEQGGRAVPVLAITNARIHPVTAPAIERGTILIRGGRIEAVGANVAVPPGAETLDAAGADVYPGWINARSTLGLAEPGPRGFDDVSEMLDFNPHLRTRVAFHSDSDGIPVARATGVTTVALTPAGGLLGGEVAVMNLDGWTWEENTVEPVAGISFQFPTLVRTGFAAFFGPPQPDPTYEELKKERDARLDELAQLLGRARAYAGNASPDRPVDWVLEALVPVVERKIPLLTTAVREQDIRDAIAFADRTGIRIVVSGALEASLVAPLLREKNIPVILGSVLTLPTREDMPHAATYRAAGELAEAGVKFAFATGDAHNVRLLPYHAAQSVAWGLSHENAIRALTIDAAEILGVADRLGSIEPGKMANLLIAKGDPLELRTELTHVIINGRSVGLANRQQAQYERYLARP